MHVYINVTKQRSRDLRPPPVSWLSSSKPASEIAIVTCKYFNDSVVQVCLVPRPSKSVRMKKGGEARRSGGQRDPLFTVLQFPM